MSRFSALLQSFALMLLLAIYGQAMATQAVAANAQPVAPQTTTPTINLDELKPIGQASLRVFWFDIYDATLFNTSGVFEKDSPTALQLIYQRNFRKENLVKETRKQLSGKIDAELMEQGLQQLSTIWPDIKKQDSLTFYLQDADSGQFFHNGLYIGDVSAEGFARAFLDIWIGEQCQYPKLAAQLTGREGSDSSEGP